MTSQINRKVSRPGRFAQFIRSRSEIQIGFIALFLASAVVVGTSIVLKCYSLDFFKNILVEAHGMLMDILIIGIFILWLNNKSKEHQEVKLLRQQISDFRTWNSDEAAFRIAGIMKRLSNIGITKIDLFQCYIKGVTFQQLMLSGANCWAVNFSNTIFHNTSFHDCKMKGAAFNDCHAANITLENCYLKIAKFDGADFNGAKFSASILVRASFKNCYLRHANFNNTDCTEADFENADLSGANMKNTVGITPEQLFKAKSIKGLIADSALIDKIEFLSPGRISIFTAIDGKQYRKIK